MWQPTVKEKHTTDFVLSENHVHSQLNYFLVAFRKSPARYIENSFNDILTVAVTWQQ